MLSYKHWQTNFQDLVQFAGGFNAADKIHPDYKKYNQRLQDMLKGGMGGEGVEMSKFAPGALSQLQNYPEYNAPGASIVMVPIGSQVTSSGSGSYSVTLPPGGDSSPPMVMGKPPSQMVNSLMKSLLLTNLSQT